MRLTSLRRKLALGYMGLIAALIALTGYFVLGYVTDQMIAMVVRDLTTRGQLVEQLTLAGWPWPDNVTGDALAARVAASAQARVTIIALDGTVLAESEQPSASMVNHGGRPEFQTALAGQVGEAQRISDTRADRMLYVALPPSAQLPAVIRLAVSLEWVWARVAAVRTGLGAALGGGLLTAALAGLWMGSRLLTRPLGTIVAGARRLVAGDLTSRIAVQTGDEWEVLAGALNGMAGSLETQMASLTTERNRVRQTLEELPDGVLLISASGALRLANRRARGWLALPDWLGDYGMTAARTESGPGPTQRHQASNILARTPELRNFVQDALALPGPHEAEMTIRTPAPVKVLASARPMVRHSSETVTADLLVVLRDLSEIRRLEQARRELVANVSHELKTPIGAIRVLAETLTADATPNPAVVNDFLGRIVRETERLNTLVEEMLYLSRLENAQEPLTLSDGDLGAAAAWALESLLPLAAAKGISVTLDAAAEVIARFDHRQIGRAIAALLDNAIKFSPPSGLVTIDIRESAGKATVTVGDRGPGIAQQDLDRVYERFFKAEPSRQGTGSGLGLAIVKHIVQAHGGRAFVRSTLGQGSVFGFDLPKAGPTAST